MWTDCTTLDPTLARPIWATRDKFIFLKRYLIIDLQKYFLTAAGLSVTTLGFVLLLLLFEGLLGMSVQPWSFISQLTVLLGVALTFAGLLLDRARPTSTQIGEIMMITSLLVGVFSFYLFLNVYGPLSEVSYIPGGVYFLGLAAQGITFLAYAWRGP